MATLDALWGLALLGGLYPLVLAWRRVRSTPLRSAVAWAFPAWLAWLASAVIPADALRYLALCLTACPGVAVLGARRPGAGAWNFVVLGLLVLLLRPLLEGLGQLRLEAPHLIFLGFVLAVGSFNYLPTANGPAVLLLAVGWGVELAPWAGVALPPEVAGIARWGLPPAPWLALGLAGWGLRGASEADRLWLTFRNRFGLVWGQRAREQFNRAAANAGWAVRLGWGGLRQEGEGKVPDPAKVTALLRGVLKRFGPDLGPSRGTEGEPGA